MGEGGPKFERGDFSRERQEDGEEKERGREEEPGLKQERKIFTIESKLESERPESRPEDRIETGDEIRERVRIERDRTIETGVVGPVVFAYPSGLAVEFRPVFDGRPSIESFTGLYTGSLVIPKEYDKERKQDMNDDAIQRRLGEAEKRISLQPKIIENTLSDPAKRKLSYGQYVEVVLSNHFSVAYDDLKQQWIISVDQDALKDSERNVFAIFHELGHVPYMAFEDELLPAALQKESKLGGKSFETLYDNFIKGASGYISAMREDLAKLDPGLLQTLEQQIKEAVKYKSGEYRPGKASSVLRRQKREAGAAGETSKQDLIQSVLTKLSIFAERMADARAAALAHRLRQKHGGVDLEFDNSDDMKKFYHQALDSYVQTHSEPRFHTGLREHTRKGYSH